MKKSSDNRRFEEKFQEHLRDALLDIWNYTRRVAVRVKNGFKLIWKGICWFVEETKPAPKPTPRKKTRKKVTTKKKVGK
tara:strand:- start:139 stop:375 length:237 start_codon:yes stop_codon:yes gene_type:complete